MSEAQAQNFTQALEISPTELQNWPTAESLDAATEAEITELMGCYEEGSVRHSMPKDLFEKLADRVLRLSENDPALLMNFTYWVQPQGEKRSEQPDEKFLVDRLFEYGVVHYNDHPGASHELFNFLGQELTVRADVFVNAITEHANSPDLQEELFQSAVYMMSYDNGYYSNEMIRQIDLNSPEKYYRSGVLIEFIGRLYPTLADYGWSDSEGADNLKKVLTQAVEGDASSYLLQSRAKDLLQNLDTGNTHTSVFSYDPDSAQVTFQKLEIDTVADSQNFRDFLYFSSPQMQRHFKEDFRISLDILHPQEQYYLLLYLKEKNTKEIESVRQFIQRFGNDGLRAFLSLRSNPEAGDMLVGAYGKVDAALLGRLLEKHSQVLDAAFSVEDFVRENFHTQAEYEPAIASHIREGLIRKGANLLTRYLSRPEDVDEARMTAELDAVKGEHLLFLESFKTLHGAEVSVDLSSVEGLEFGEISVGSLSADDKERMVGIYAENYRNTPNIARTLVENFRSQLLESDDELFVLRHNGQVVGFFGLSETQPHNFYFKAFNVVSEYRGGALGEAMMEQSLDRVAEANLIKAECNELLPISGNYIERGFVGIYRDQILELGVLAIARHDAKSEVFITKGMTSEELVALGKNGEDVDILDGKAKVVTRTIADVASIPFGEYLASSNEAESNSTEQYALTRYIFDRKKGEVYAVFEKVSSQAIADYLKPPVE